MNEILQPGQHPDADQLSAFVEHALPLHEQQQTLAHLATCADCRAIVYFAEPTALEGPARPQAVAARKPWSGWSLFSGWTLVWPAAAALACLIILTVHLHNATIGKSRPAAVNTAHLEQTPPALPQAPQPEPAISPEPASAPIQTKQAIVADKLGGAGLPASGYAGSISGVSVRKSPALEGRGRAALAIGGPELGLASTTSLGQQSVAASMPGASLQPATPAPASPLMAGAGGAGPAPQATTSNMNAGRVQLRSSAPQYNSAVAAPPPAPPEAASALGLGGVHGGTGATNLNENYVRGLSLSNLTTQGDTLAKAKAVTADAVSAGAGAAAPAPTQNLPTLPSKLAAISVAANSRQQLAIDSAGTTFRSEDAGVTWQAVPAQWTGRAVKVSMIGAPSREIVAKKAGALTSSAALKRTEAAPSPVFELTTATGEVWISADGQTWKPK
jgi:hypothetical protein